MAICNPKVLQDYARYAWCGIIIRRYLLPYRAGGKSQRSYNTAVLPKNPMFHFLFIFGSFLRFRRRVWFTVAIFGSFFISFLVHFYCQLNMVGSKNEPKMRSKMTQKRPKSATVSTPSDPLFEDRALIELITISDWFQTPLGPSLLVPIPPPIAPLHCCLCLLDSRNVVQYVERKTTIKNVQLRAFPL